MTGSRAALRHALSERGRLTFPEFLETILHGPGGYYASQRIVVGQHGDFYTSPEVHPVFGELVAIQAEAIWVALGRPSRFAIIEHGAGSGALAIDLLRWIARERPEFATAVRYVIVERSAELIERQKGSFLAAELKAVEIAWHEGSATELLLVPFDGMIVCNELLDALPFNLVEVRDGLLRELYVVEAGGDLALESGPPSTPELEHYFSRVGIRPPEGMRTEVRPLACVWLGRAAEQLRRGALLVIDYGTDAATLYGGMRPHGTLRCYFQHTVNDRPLERPGEQDVTADVDFTSLVNCASTLGLVAQGPISQQDALARLGIEAARAAVARVALPNPERDVNFRALQALSEPDGLGALRWLLLSRSMPDFVAFRPASTPAWALPPLLQPWHMRLPGPENMEMLGDFSELWNDYWSDSDSDEGPPAPSGGAGTI